MYTSKWQKISSVLDILLMLEKEEQIPYLNKNYSKDQDLINEVTGLIDAISESENIRFLENFHKDNSALINDLTTPPGIDTHLPDNLLGELIGPYKIVSIVGKGGMGNVYKAERTDSQFEQVVAIKFISHKHFNDHIKLRFRQEQKILASLKHPNIALMFDGGVTKDGLPYLVMEYIEGTPINEYCNQHGLNIAQRLSLFQKVLLAINYAHSNLVVHRDIKPANIYVSDAGNIKIMDFGIAKLLDEENLLDASLTQPGQRLWTPNYAAPEQVLERPPLLQTDIYALGSLLYVLLTNTLPFNFENKSLHEVEEIILKDVPLSLTESIATQSEAELISNFRMKKSALIGAIKGDLEAIVTKAMRKEPEARYNSISAFSGDINRYQKSLPVTATKGNFSYYSKKFVLRNKKPLGVSILVLLVITSIVGYYTHQLQEERRSAELEAKKATEIANYLSELFSKNYPEIAQGKELTARQLLDEGSNRINTLEDQPEIQVSMLNLFGSIYRQLDDFSKSDSIVKKAIEINEQLDSPDQNELAFSHYLLALINRDKSNYKESISHFKQSLELEKKNQPEADSNYAIRLSAFAYVLRLDDKLEEAAERNSEAIEIQRRIYGDKNIRLAESLYVQASILRVLGRYDEALNYQLASYNMVNDLVTPPHPGLVVNLSNLAIIYDKINKLDSAEMYIKESLEMSYKLNGENHSSVARGLSILAAILQKQDKLQEALEYQIKALNMVTDIYGPNDLSTAHEYHNLGTIYLKLNDLNKADSVLTKAMQIKIDILGENSMDNTYTLNNLAELEKKRGNTDKAIAYLEQSLKIRMDILGESHDETQTVMKSLSKFQSQ